MRLTSGAVIGSLMAFALVGCGQSSPASTTDAAGQDPSPSAAPTLATPSTSPSAAAPETVVLHGDGVGSVWLGMEHEAARRALVRLWGEPDTDEVEFCSLHTTEEESRDRTLIWGDLQVSVREDSDGEVRVAGWSVQGPQTPAGVVTPYGVVPEVDTKATLLRSVPGVSIDEETDDRLGPGHYIRGQLQWIVEDSGELSGAYVNPAICD